MKKIITILILLMLVANVTALQVQEFREPTLFERLFGSGFSIVLSQSVVNKGDPLIIEDIQSLNDICQSVGASLQLKDSNDRVVDTVSHFVDGVLYPQNLYLRVKQDTSALQPGNYLIEINWFCEKDNANNILGQDGKVDSNQQPTTKTFEVVDNDESPVQTCGRSCNSGYKLINPNSPDCFCEKTWTAGNGVCESFEPVGSLDCDFPEEPVPPGGTGGGISDSMLGGIVIGVLILFVGLILIMRK